MNLRTRRFLVLGLALIFLVLSPLLILYGLGYKYNWQKNRLEKTGVFFIKSFPKDADVFLNGDRHKKTTPSQITRLLPKIYEVKISKEGFLPWIKNLAIQSQTATFIEDVSLIYQTPKITAVVEGIFTELLPDSNRENFALIEQLGDEQILWHYNAGDNKITRLYSSAEQPLALVGWSSSNKKILFKAGNHFLTVHKDSPGLTTDLQNLTKGVLTDVKWHSQNDNLLYGLTGSQLLLINLPANTATPVNTEMNFTFLPYKNGALTLVKNPDGFFLKSYLPGENRIIFSLPEQTDYNFSQNQAGDVVLHDQNEKQLYLISPEDKNQPVKTILKNVAGFGWLGRSMVYWDNAELWVYYPEFNQQVFLERTSQKISRAFWHPNAVYVYAEVGNQLKLYELDSRDARNVYDILEIDPEQSGLVSANKKGDWLFASATIDNVPGFYKFEIQP
ncbi:MAG: PEGA domain-containing protein [Candidatus Komeilibacteria bacterium]|nr:PEGA domain-containing protein [Candidatus Komeilibacteria bacterium]